MDFRPRFMDVFALLGILLLVSVVPGYVAQDEDARAFADGARFRTGEGRIGSVLDLEALFAPEGEAPVLVGPVATHRIRAPVDGEVPVAAFFVYEHIRHPVDLSFSWGRVHQQPDEERVWFDATGAPVWREQRSIDVLDDGTTRVTVRGHRVAAGDDVSMTWQVGHDTTFRPSLGELAFIEATSGLQHSFATEVLGYDVSPPRSADQVLRHRDMHLFRTGTHALDRLLFDEDECHSCSGDHDLELAVEFRPGLVRDANSHPQYEWVMPEWPVAVGMHMPYHDADTGERFFVQTVMPRSLAVGDGPRVSIRHFELFGRSSNWLLERGDPTLPLTPLRTIVDDPRPLLGAIGFDDLQAAVRSDAAPRDVRAFAQDARPVEFTWLVGEPEHDVPEPAGPVVPVVEETAPEAFVRHPSRWFVTLMRPDGAVRGVDIRLVEEEGVVEVVSVQDVCDRDLEQADPHAVRVTCQRRDPAVLGPRWVVPDPWSLIRAAEADRAARAATPSEGRPLWQFSYMPLASLDVIGPPGFAMAEYNVTMFEPSAFFSHFPTAERGDDLLHGIAFYDDPSPDGRERVAATFDLRDGRLLHGTHRVDGAEPAPASAATASVAGEGLLVPLDVVAGSAVTGGILLIGLSALGRALAWLKAGGSVPVIAALYAKIKKADVLLHARRDQIMDLVRADPGVTASDVARVTGFGWGATVHHLETLVRNGLLIAVMIGGRRHYFTADEGTRLSRLEAAARRDAQAATLLDAVAARPGSTLKELAAFIGRQSSGLSRTGSRLVKEGLLRKERDGMHVRFWPISMASAAPGRAHEPVAADA